MMVEANTFLINFTLRSKVVQYNNTRLISPVQERTPL